MRLEIRQYHDVLIAQCTCDPDTALEFCDWVEENQIELKKLHSFDYNGDRLALDLDRIRLDAHSRDYRTGRPWPDINFSFAAVPDNSLLMLFRLRWNDHFLGIEP